MANIQDTNDIQDTDKQPNAGQDVERQELSPAAAGNTKRYSHPGRLSGGFLQNSSKSI